MTFPRETEKTVTDGELELIERVDFGVIQTWAPHCLLHLVGVYLWTGC